MTTINDAILFCRLLEPLLSAEFDAHIALTGGSLYKEGTRKDIDVIIYPHNMRPDLVGTSRYDRDNITARISESDEITGFLEYANVTKFGWLDHIVDVFWMDRIPSKITEYGSSAEDPAFIAYMLGITLLPDNVEEDTGEDTGE